MVPKTLFILVSIIVVSPAMAARPKKRQQNTHALRGPSSPKTWSIVRANRKGYYRSNRSGYYGPRRPYRGRARYQTRRVIVVVKQAPKRTHKRSIIRPKPRVKIIINPFATNAKRNKPHPITTRARIIAESKAKARSY